MQIRCLAIAAVVLASSRAIAADDSAFFDVDIKRGVVYYDGEGFDKTRHNLDLYLPKDHKNYPVLFMVHGGGWSLGDKNQLGIYSSLGRNLARHGIGMVSTNYRLSPAVKHPEHIRDVARSFAWVHKNIGKYGGNNREMFVGGHSAGGHLSALLATDETYLKEQGLSLRDIKGAIPVSGVFTIPTKRNAVFDKVFAQDEAVRDKASPTKQARAGLPPFLILYASFEVPYCDRPYAEGFCKALTDAKNQAVAFEFKPRNHLTIMMNATREVDPVFQSILSFITTQVALERMCCNGCDGVECLQMCLARYLAPGKIAIHRQGVAMSEPLLRIPNHHSADCGAPPMIATDDRDVYIGYFENPCGEQWVFTYDRKTRQAQLRGGDIGWDSVYTMKDAKVEDLIMGNEERAWLQACWRAAMIGIREKNSS